MRSSSIVPEIIALPLATIATLLTVVACGPNKNYVPVKLVPGTPIGQAIAKCTDEIRPSTAKVVTASVTMCEVVKDDLYEKTQHAFRYDVQSVEGRLRLTVRPALDFASEVSAQDSAQVKTVIDRVCSKRIQGIFHRSFKRGGIDAIDFSLVIDSKPAADSPIIDLKSKSGPETTFVMKGWPDRANLYPYGLKKDNDTCEKLSTSEDDKRRCRWAAVEAANEEFCQQLAARTGHWLGLKMKDSRCKDKSVADDQAAIPTKPTPETDSVYMKGAYEMSPKEFFAKAALSRADMKAVFAPACSSFRNLPENAAFQR